MAVVAVAVIGFIVFSGGGTSGGGLDDPSDETPTFAFRVRDQRSVSTMSVETKKLKAPMKHATSGASELLNAVYTAGYLDPANWRSGSYDAVLEAFDAEARTAAQDELDGLTAGPDAGATYRTIEPGRSNIATTVLLDDKDHPAAVEAEVTFVAVATTQDGSVAKLMSSGQFFLRPVQGGNWTIAAFEVDRKTKAAEAVATPTEATS